MNKLRSKTFVSLAFATNRHTHIPSVHYTYGWPLGGCRCIVMCCIRIRSSTYTSMHGHGIWTLLLFIFGYLFPNNILRCHTRTSIWVDERTAAYTSELNELLISFLFHFFVSFAHSFRLWFTAFRHCATYANPLINLWQSINFFWAFFGLLSPSHAHCNLWNK